MCSHSSSGAEITEKIANKLYPFIASLFQEIIVFEQGKHQIDEDSMLHDGFYQLKSEFESLRNYEVKLVFPSVLKVFNTKDEPNNKPSLNVKELQRLTQNKEGAISEWVSKIEQEAELVKLPKSHPLFQLLFVFQTSFVAEKQQWNAMLNGWSLGCACFVAAQQSTELPENS
jgi:hypothetical protein